ncbi:hypothetical protein [Shivajiella indica]|uniref:Uncharacterized protein n=1 Tax=Shivajiella indica TaxID=872115 RepID=A0ABW5B3K2_9BACT
MKYHLRINLILFLLLIFQGYANGQGKSELPLFSESQPLEMRLSFSSKDLKKEKADSVYFPSIMHYKIPGGSWDSIKVDIRARGNFRRNQCFFPPIRVKIKKKDGNGTVFEGNKALKLVVPCKNAKADNDQIVKEYMCYKMNEQVSPFFFSTRAVNLILTDESTKNPKSYEVKAFLIEDDDLVAERAGGKIAGGRQILPGRLQEIAAVQVDFFQFMIANTDWSAVAQHNIKIIQMPTNDFVPVAYDFDMSGIVNSYYSTTSEMLNISSVRERLYRGFCRSEAAMQQVRQEYLAAESNIMQVVNGFESELGPKEVSDIKKYMEDFFAILKSDKLFSEQILSKCRTN